MRVKTNVKKTDDDISWEKKTAATIAITDPDKKGFTWAAQ